MVDTRSSTCPSESSISDSDVLHKQLILMGTRCKGAGAGSELLRTGHIAEYGGKVLWEARQQHLRRDVGRQPWPDSFLDRCNTHRCDHERSRDQKETILDFTFFSVSYLEHNGMSHSYSRLSPRKRAWSDEVICRYSKQRRIRVLFLFLQCMQRSRILSHWIWWRRAADQTMNAGDVGRSRDGGSQWRRTCRRVHFGHDVSSRGRQGYLLVVVMHCKSL